MYFEILGAVPLRVNLDARRLDGRIPLRVNLDARRLDGRIPLRVNLDASETSAARESALSDILGRRSLVGWIMLGG
ncbi:MAG: hypothetical protein WCK35_12680 [Chloroflexota bacterium]